MPRIIERISRHEFEDIMEQINGLVDEALALIPDNEPGAKSRAKAYWAPTIKGCVDGRTTMTSMGDTMEEIWPT